MIIALVILSIFVIVFIVGIIHLYKRSERIKQNDKPEPTKKYDFIIRKTRATHHGVHPHIIFDKYTDGQGNKHLKAVCISHEWKRRKEKNPVKLKYGIDPKHRFKKAYVIHEIVDKKANAYKKYTKYMNYGLTNIDKKFLANIIKQWETEPNNYTEPKPKGEKFKKMMNKQQRRAKIKAQKRVNMRNKQTKR